MTKKTNNGHHSPERYYDVAQVAERWGVCDKTVRRRIKNKELVAHRFGRSVRISQSNLRAYEEAHCPLD